MILFTLVLPELPGNSRGNCPSWQVTKITPGKEMQDGNHYLTSTDGGCRRKPSLWQGVKWPNSIQSTQ